MRKDSIPIADVSELIIQWDWEANNKISLFPSTYSCGSQKHAWWVCNKHKCSYKQIIRDRFRKKIGCGICKKEIRSSLPRERYIKGKKTLAETHPALAEEWVWCEDPRYTPQTSLAGSNKVVIWKCKKCNETYPAHISNRALLGSKCPYCAGQKPLPNKNSLQHVNPVLALEWSPKNKIAAADVTAKSNQKVLWICKLGHEDYPLSVKRRSNGQGCPVCSLHSQTSFPEQALFYYIRQIYPDAINRYLEEKCEIDVYIPSKKTGFEYNGYFYHKNKGRQDKSKKEVVTSKGITLKVIKEYKVTTECINADYYIRENPSLKKLSSLIKKVILELDPKQQMTVNCERDMMTIREQYINSIKENSVAKKRPDLAIEWDHEKNGKIRPEFVTYGSNQEYYWKCPRCNNSYLASPKARNTGEGCKYCAGKAVKPGTNDLLSQFPSIAAEWDYEKNKGLTPDQVSYGEGKEVWWLCNIGHSWSAPINRRTSNKSGCPYCAGRKVAPGFNDLLSQRPEVAKDWDYDKNSLIPEEIHYNNQTEHIFWKCHKCGHKWEATVNKYHKCVECKKRGNQINVYNASDYSIYGSFQNAKQLCAHFGIDYNKQHGNISTICNKKRGTLLKKYILRYARNDEFLTNNYNNVKA